MDEVAFVYEQLINKIKIYQNGVISENLRNRGFKNLLNYGVPLTLIDKIAVSVKKNNKLAIYCWQQRVREAKLLALRIFDSGSLDIESFNILITGIENSEIAEQLAFKLLVHLPGSLEISMKLINSQDKMVKYCGLITLNQIARNNKDVSIEEFKKILEHLYEQEVEDDIFIKNGLSKALIQISLRNKELKRLVLNWISNYKIKNQSISNWLDQEVMYYLVT
jgi:hypothetical protein